MDEIEARQNRALANAIRGITLWSLVGVLFLLFEFETVQLRGGAWAGAATLSLALLLGGYLLGLLFAVPKTPPSDGDTATQTTAQQRRILLVNTSFEQISDWLTKIIVGIGLVQFQPILSFVEMRIEILARDLSTTSFSETAAGPVAAAIVLGFPTLGLLLGFFSVRLYIAWAIYVADADATRPLSLTPSQKGLAAVLGSAAPSRAVNRGSDEPSNGDAAAPLAAKASTDTIKAIDQILDLPLEKLTVPNDIVAWGRACVARGRYEDARKAFERAIQETGGDPEVVLEYVNTLYHISPIDRDAMIKALERALPRIDTVSDIKVRHGVVENLINAYLYLPPPDGFEKALALGEKYVAGEGAQRYAAYVYLAAGHGQRYTYYKREHDPRAADELANLLSVVHQAIAIGHDRAREWLIRLMTPGGEDDLVEASKDSADLRKLLRPEEPAR